MIGLDTNILARYIMQDEVVQARLVTELMESLTVEDPGFVALVSVIELVWVLSGCYALSREQQASAVEALLQVRVLHIEHAERVLGALRTFRAGTADLADCLIARSALANGCERIMTFDQKAAKSTGMTLLS